MSRTSKALAILAAIILPGGIVFLGLAALHAVRELQAERKAKLDRIARAKAFKGFAVPINPKQRLTQEDDTQRIQYMSNAELIALDPEGVFHSVRH